MSVLHDAIPVLLLLLPGCPRGTKVLVFPSVRLEATDDVLAVRCWVAPGVSSDALELRLEAVNRSSRELWVYRYPFGRIIEGFDGLVAMPGPHVFDEHVAGDAMLAPVLPGETYQVGFDFEYDGALVGSSPFRCAVQWWSQNPHDGRYVEHPPDGVSMTPALTVVQDRPSSPTRLVVVTPPASN